MDECYQRWLGSPDNNNSGEYFPLQKKIHQFEDWVLKHFVDALPEASAGWMNKWESR